MRFRPDGHKAAAALLIAACTALPTLNAHAQANSIFPTGWDSNVRSRLFMRIGYTSAFTKTKSEDARDITGDVVSRAQLKAAFKLADAIVADCPSGGGAGSIYSAADCARYATSGENTAYEFAAGLLFGTTSYANPDLNAEPEAADTYFGTTGAKGFGIPSGITARAQRQIGTPTLSIGYWIDDDRKWLLEGFLLAAPMSIKIYGGGDNGLNGRHLATTKLLPPLVIGSYNFGKKEDLLRPYVGVGAMYAVFFGGKSTSFFDEYQGGKTTVTTRNTFGVGPFAGLQTQLNDEWHVNVSVGRIGLRTTSRLVTSNTTITSDSAVLQDISKFKDDSPRDLSNLLELGEDAWQTGGFTTRIMELAARVKGQPNQGTFVREQKMKITNTIVTVSVGRSF